jgi:hypothetical protein
MTQGESHRLWLKDILEHLRESQDQLDWTEDPDAALVVLDGIIRDLDCGKRVCEAMKARLKQRLALVHS